MPGAMPAAMPAAMPRAMPGAMPGAMPAYLEASHLPADDGRDPLEVPLVLRHPRLPLRREGGSWRQGRGTASACPPPALPQHRTCSPQALRGSRGRWDPRRLLLQLLRLPAGLASLAGQPCPQLPRRCLLTARRLSTEAESPELLTPLRSPLWPAAACQVCWPTAAWPPPPSSSAAWSGHPATAARSSCAGQRLPERAEQRLSSAPPPQQELC